MSDEIEHSASERAVLVLLKEKYESDGYSFIMSPGVDFAPEFLGSFVPDAIALKGDERIAIEIKASKSGEWARRKRERDALFDNLVNWTHRVYFRSDFSNRDNEIEPMDAHSIEARFERAKQVVQLGFNEEAFLLFWPIFEAVLRAIPFTKYPASRGRPLLPKTVINSLENATLLDFSDAAVLRSLVGKRNRIVHGDGSVSVSSQDLKIVTRIVKKLIKEL